MSEYNVIGIMSGSSLDGLDLCACHFLEEKENWSYRIQKTETIDIPVSLKELLIISPNLSSKDLLALDASYGEWIGKQLKEWISDHQLSPDLIGIHGHTVFHEPTQKYSLQIGSGEAIKEVTGMTVVDNFRTADVLKGGEGAPLVPVGEHYLLAGYDAFLNLGGIANISVHKERITAWDIAPCNQVFNYFASKVGKEYDEGGGLAASGTLDDRWLDQISNLSYFRQAPPKSLSNQWTENILKSAPEKPADALHTYVHFLAMELHRNLQAHLPKGGRVLLTGGGTFNNYLIEQLRIAAGGSYELKVPEADLVSFKEALIFGFLGLLKMLGRVNIFHSVTGAGSDSVAGVIHNTGHPFPASENC